MDLYVRQRQLLAVGELGQQRIEQAGYAVETGMSTAISVERDYLERAGARRFSVVDHAPGFAHASAFHDAAAREFATGAWRALRQLRRALEAP